MFPVHSANYFVGHPPQPCVRICLSLSICLQCDVKQIKALKEVALVGGRVVLGQPFHIPRECMEVADLISFVKPRKSEGSFPLSHSLSFPYVWYLLAVPVTGSFRVLISHN